MRRVDAGCLPAEDLAGSAVDGGLDGEEVLLGAARQVGALGKYCRSSPWVFSFVPHCQAVMIAFVSVAVVP